ncbi:MAG TPA: hypothetical protein VH268_12895, partial [Solirubrobacterales bacterium]|nr:hypothetical protein [Solirubrobacterales bacterium]
MPFSKSKPGRSPLQRLSDQRRSMALAGLAVGAVASATIFRRKRRGAFAVEPPLPPNRPAPQPESGPPAAIAMPVPANEPEVVGEPLPEATEVEETAINAAPSVGGEASAAKEPTSGAAAASASSAEPEPAVGGGSAAPVEPATGELSAEEASILAVLAQSGRTDDDRTALAVATSLERETTDVSGVLRKLGNEGVVSGELYTAGGDKIWAVTERGVR